MRARACVRTRVHACVRDVFAIYYNNILPMLIIIIIKIIILYFIQFRHTDDFPSTGSRLVKLLIRTHHEQVKLHSCLNKVNLTLNIICFLVVGNVDTDTLGIRQHNT